MPRESWMRAALLAAVSNFDPRLAFVTYEGDVLDKYDLDQMADEAEVAYAGEPHDDSVMVGVVGFTTGDGHERQGTICGTYEGVPVVDVMEDDGTVHERVPLADLGPRGERGTLGGVNVMLEDDDLKRIVARSSGLGLNAAQFMRACALEEVDRQAPDDPESDGLPPSIA